MYDYNKTKKYSKVKKRKKRTSQTLVQQKNERKRKRIQKQDRHKICNNIFKYFTR